jgi:hypothetical protein
MTGQHRLRSRSTTLAVLIAAMTFTACDWLPVGYTPIAELLRAPGEYEGKTVKVRGRVIDAVKLPIVELRYYALRDGDAELVVCASNSVPAVGAQVTVVGTVDNAAIIGGQAIGLHLVEQRRW